MTDRPQRHRRCVNHYSDDNPSTFTVKRKRGEALPPPPSSAEEENNAAQRRAARSEERRQRQRHPMMSGLLSSPGGGAKGSGVKRGPGRPPNPFKNPLSRKRRLSKTDASSTNHHNNSTEKPTSLAKTGTFNALIAPTGPPSPSDQICSHAVSIQPVLPLQFPERPSLEQKYPHLYRQDYVANQVTSVINNLNTQWTRIPPAQKERWVPLQQINISSTPCSSAPGIVNAAQSPDSSAQSLIAMPAAPWTCFAVRKDNPLYFCVGDAAGHLLLYTSHSKTVCIQVVHTSAAQRETERPILWSQATQKAQTNFPNSIGAATWHRNVCVVWTRQEVEILDVVKHTRLFCLPLDLMMVTNSGTGASVSSNKRQGFSLQSLDLHPSESLLLWRPSGVRVLDATENTTAEEETTAVQEGKDCQASVSLYCIDFSDRNMGAKRRVIVPKNQTQKDFHCHASVWDLHKPEELLAVISQPSANSPSMVASLCRMSLEGDISQRSTLPDSTGPSGKLNAIYTDCVLEQYDDYLFLCTGRGIRCYETNRLTFLTVYGETVALHSRTVGWQGCFWIPEPLFHASEIVISSGNKSKMACWVQRHDELQCRNEAEHEASHCRNTKHGLVRQESTSSSGSTQAPLAIGVDCSQKSNKLFSNMLLVGVPHSTRGPTELQSTLYVWKPGQVLPLTTLQTPPGGLLGLHIHATATAGWRLTCATARQGEGFQMGAILKSNFAGIMYPVGYQIINDNIEYIEDESELDQVIMVPQQEQLQSDESPQGDSKEESDLQKALQQSLETAAQDNICVLYDSEDDENKESQVMVPSVPDPSLREVFDERDSFMPRTPGRRVRSAPQVLSLFPQCKVSIEAYQEQLEETSKRQLLPPPSADDLAETIAQQQAIKMKGKRSRMASVEVLLQASIDPALKYKMGLLHKEWSSGGSRLVLGPVSGRASSVGSSQDSGTVLLNPTSMARRPLEPPPVCIPSNEFLSASVSPSEPSPTSATIGEISFSGHKTAVHEGLCLACHERMVIHTCGKRELPVDTEALERAERLRKEEEEAEAKRARAERRRLAEAKRREARRKKKEEEERRQYFARIEEQRRQRAEEEQVAADRQRIASLAEPFQSYEPPVVSVPKPRPTIPKFSELHGGVNGCNPTATSTAAVHSHGFYNSSAATTEDSYPRETSPTNGKTDSYASTTNEWSTSSQYYKDDSGGDAATDGDALAALVGLAGSLAPASRAAPEVSHYDYSGSLDRRSAILAQYSSQFKELAPEPDETPGEPPSYSTYASRIGTAFVASSENGHCTTSNTGCVDDYATGNGISYYGPTEWPNNSYANGGTSSAPQEEAAATLSSNPASQSG